MSAADGSDGVQGVADNDGVRIAYEVRDDAGADRPWVVLVHGLGYGRWGWEPVVDGLARRFRVLLLDNRGIGGSDVPEGPYTAQVMAGDVVAVMDAAGVERAHVVGTSLGGMVVQELAARHPDRVDRLVLAASTPGGDRAHPMPEVTRELLAQMPQLPPEEALRRAVENALADPVDEAVVERIMQHRLSDPQDPAGWQAQAAAGTTYDPGDSLGAIRAPTLVLHGTHDVVLDPRDADVLGEVIPDARVERLDTGHLLFWDAPDRFVGIVVDFLEDPS